MQTIRKRCILLSSIANNLTIDTLSIVRQVIRVSLPFLCLRFSFKDFYKASKSCFINLKEIDDKDIHTSSQHFPRGNPDAK